MCIIEEPVQDGVAEGGVSDEVVPVLDGELASEDGATPGRTVVEDFEVMGNSALRELTADRFDNSLVEKGDWR